MSFVLVLSLGVHWEDHWTATTQTPNGFLWGHTGAQPARHWLSRAVCQQPAPTSYSSFQVESCDDQSRVVEAVAALGIHNMSLAHIHLRMWRASCAFMEAAVQLHPEGSPTIIIVRTIAYGGWRKFCHLRPSLFCNS